MLQSILRWWTTHTRTCFSIGWSIPPKVEAESEHEKTWFLRCAIHRCTDLYRSRKRYPLEEIPETTPCPTDNTTEVMDVLLSLPEKYRTPLYLHGGCGFSIRETARAMDMTEAALRMRLTRARRALAAALDLDYNRKKEEIL